MKKVIIPVVLAVAVIAVSLFLARDYLMSSSHPRVEAHRFLEQKTPAAVVYEWIPYYYRHPQPQETVKVIEVLLAQDKVDPARMAAQNHFFAAILHEHREELEKLKTASQRYSGNQSARLAAIIKETESYEPVKEISPANLESLWGEYMATGKQEIITRMTQALERAKSEENQELLEALQESFYRHLPSYADAYKVFYEAGEKSPGALGSMGEEMRKVINKTFAEPAKMHLVRADNHLKQREYNQALDEFEKSLKYYPDYPEVFIRVANLYEQQGKVPEALAAMNKAVQVNPLNPWATYGMGRLYFQQKQYDEAIAWESKALASQPKHPVLLHAIARSYQSKGDTANAVKYFQQYLELAPNGEHVDLVKQYLASVKVPVAESNTLVDAFKRRDFEALENQFAALLKEKKPDKDGRSVLSRAYDQICDYPYAKYDMEKWLGNFEAWLQSKPSSHFANTAIGIFYVNYAWHARGSGWSNTVTQEGWRLFKERLLKARNYLEKAYVLDPSDPMAPRWLIKVALGLGSDRTEMEKQFHRAMQADPTEYTAYFAKLTYLMPKWHGSEEEMFAFARETARNAPADSLAPLVLANAHWEIYFRSENKKLYFKQPEVWSEVKAVYATLCRQFPESKERHNWFARAAYLAGDFETARQELALIQDDWSQDVWGNYAYFTKVKGEILGK